MQPGQHEHLRATCRQVAAVSSQEWLTVRIPSHTSVRSHTSNFASSPLRIPRDDTRSSCTYHLDTCLGYNFHHYTTLVRPTGRPHWPFS